MLSCKEVSRLSSEQFDRRLNWRERGQVWLHLRVCAACNRVLAQLKFLRQTMDRYRAGKLGSP